MDLAELEDENGINQVDDVAISMFTAIIQKIADARAENGAEQQRIQTSYELHSSNLVNLEAAHGRIMDVDVALESTRFARHNVLVQASASMTAQANQLTQVALTLLQ
jgi:flagellin